MEEVQLYTCLSPVIKQYYLPITAVSLLSWFYFIRRAFGEEFRFGDAIAFSLMIYGVLTFFVYILDDFYLKSHSPFVSILKIFSNISVCFDSQLTNYKDPYSINKYVYPENTNRVVIISTMLFFGVSRIIYEFVRYTYFIPEAMGRFIKNISLHILLVKEERKLKALRSEEAGKLNAVKLQLKSALETEQKTVEKTLSQLAAQRQRVAASRQKLMAKDMDQE